MNYHDDYSVINDQWPESQKLCEIIHREPLDLDRCHTMPSLKISTPIEDLMASTLMQHLNIFVERPTVSKDMTGVKQLIANGHLRAAVNLTGELLTELKQGFGMAGHSSNSKYCFEIWACRMQLLMALKMYSLLLEELLAFDELEAPDVYYQYYPNTYKSGEKGSLVPFSLRLVHAEAPRFTSFPWTALQRIRKLEKNVNELLNTQSLRNNEFIKVWESRLTAVRKLHARTLYSLKEYTTAMILYNRISENQTELDQRDAMKLMLMRMAMEIGDERKMEHFLAEVSSINSDQSVFHRSLKQVFHGNYQQAHEILCNHSNNSASPEVKNNSAICMLYIGQIKEAMEKLLEVVNQPNESIAINLYTMSELVIPHFARNSTKLFVERFIHLPDMFDPSVIKLNGTL